MSKSIKYVVLFVGMILVAISWLILSSKFQFSINEKILNVTVVLGLGCIGYSLGELIKIRITRKNPRLEKDMKLILNDERVIYLNALAKAKSFDILIYLNGFVLITLFLMDVSLNALLVIVFTNIFTIGYYLFKRTTIDNAM